ncbi:hypothetical protein J2755_000981 [Methanohalophilus levihalophilus]|uniref:hypothetical protein n=1 Tax=Methanohalophilus levihalophilus TaxID=1431282 RepID=UPI001AE239D8|nr:hypothetical protein [Methanohalophilus levihalophilus]MBP2030047.1 hypothetical protein [Methanohalophilus levihalophilus]
MNSTYVFIIALICVELTFLACLDCVSNGNYGIGFLFLIGAMVFAFMFPAIAD